MSCFTLRDNLLFDLGQTPFVSGIEQERLMGTIRILAAVALLAGIGFTAFDDVVTLTVGTRHSHQHHSFSLQMREEAWDSSVCKSISRTQSAILSWTMLPTDVTIAGNQYGRLRRFDTV